MSDDDRRKKAPTFSIMAGYDYGNIKDMPRLSFLEKTLIARIVLYGTVVKLNRWKSTQQLALTGHIVLFPHRGAEGFAALGKKVFPWHEKGKVYEFIKVAFVGPTEKAEWCLKILCLPSGPLRAHYAYILQWLRLLAKINRYYVDIELPPDAILRKYLADLQSQILKRAQIASSEVSSCMEDIIGSDVAGVRTVPTDGASGQVPCEDGASDAHNVAGSRTFSA
jgi:hypothetical protein